MDCTVIVSHFYLEVRNRETTERQPRDEREKTERRADDSFGSPPAALRPLCGNANHAPHPRCGTEVWIVRKFVHKRGNGKRNREI